MILPSNLLFFALCSPVSSTTSTSPRVNAACVPVTHRFWCGIHIGGTHAIISRPWLTRWTGDNAFMQTGKNAKYDSHRRWPRRHRLHHSYTSIHRSCCNKNNDLNASHVSAWPRWLPPPRCTANRIQQYIEISASMYAVPCDRSVRDRNRIRSTMNCMCDYM